MAYICTIEAVASVLEAAEANFENIEATREQYSEWQNIGLARLIKNGFKTSLTSSEPTVYFGTATSHGPNFSYYNFLNLSLPSLLWSVNVCLS